MRSYLAIAARTLASIQLPPADERNEGNGITSFTNLMPEASFVNPVSFVPEADLLAGAELVDWLGDGHNFDGISDHVLATLRVRAEAGDVAAAAEAVRLADYLASCDRGEVRWPTHPLDAELAEWNRLCSVTAATTLGKSPTKTPVARSRRRWYS